MHAWSRIGSIAFGLLALVACSEYDARDDDQDTGNGSVDTADSGDTAPTDDTEAPPATPSWIRVDGSIVIVAGVPDAALSSLSIEYRVDLAGESPPPEASDSGLDGAAALPCTRTPGIAAFTTATSPEPAITLGWWGVTLETDADPTCDYALPSGLHLGLGELDSQLYAAMDLDGLATSGSTLHGLYARLGADGAPVWVYGVAGTADQYAGNVAPVTTPPLPDGVYDLRALHLLPFAPSP